MQALGEIIAKIEASTLDLTKYETPQVEKDEYRGEDGYIYCRNCNTRRTRKGLRYPEVRMICKCQTEERDKKQEIERQAEKQRRIDRLINMSLLGERYKNVNFENTELGSESFNVAYKRCKKYCEVASQVLDRGIGIYLFGDKGTGKTRLTACMANNLMSKYHYTTLFTNFGEISKEIRESFNKNTESERKILHRLSEVDFLFIDDLGVERVTKGEQDLWLQEKIYDVINARYNNKAPVIFTSNFSLRELIETRGIDDRTVDRIMEMTEIMRIEGTSYRAKMQRNNEKLF